MKNVYIPLLFAAALTLAGCSNSAADGKDSAAPPSPVITSDNGKLSSYTAAELLEMAENSPMHSEFLGSRGGDDLSEEAAVAYNNLIRYASNYLRDKSFCVYDIYATEKDGELSGYMLKIVPEGYENTGDHENAVVSLFCDTTGSHIKGNLAGFAYSRKWTETLADEVNDKYPSYHFSTFTLQADTDFLPIENGEQTYNLMNIGNEPMAGDWTVNLILPEGTVKTEFDKAYAELEPIFRKFSATQVTVLAADSKSSYEKFVSEEGFTGNCYYFIEDGFDWREIYTVK
ncbi:MAG: hypothetical protein IKP78_05465 [Ruminococcus sp.]|nr:hypothetical protein [Ruminococcus sp.]